MEFAWNAQKNKISDIKGKENEQERKGFIRNKDIDLIKTHLNYDLVESNLNLYWRVQKRVDEVRTNSKIQKNSVVDVSNIITLNKEQFEEWGENKSKEYFREVYNYFCDEFGKENVVSAKVHMDEITPHMHLHFVPITEEGKLQCRSVLTQSRLNKVHTNAPKYLQEKGFDVVRGKGKTKKRGNINDIHEYKKEIENILLDELNNLKIDLERHRGVLKSIQDIEHLEYKKTLLGGEIRLKKDIYNSLVNTFKSLTIENNDLKEDLEVSNKQIEKLNNKLKAMDFKLNEKDYLIVKLDKKKKRIENEIRKEFEEQLLKYKNDWWENYIKADNLAKENLNMKIENRNLEKSLNRYKNLYEQQEEIINSNPELKKMYLEKLPVEENKSKGYSMSL